MKIGILSDTHGSLPQYFQDELKTCDYLIHAGDIGTEKCYNTLKSMNIPLYMIRGNCDLGQWARYLPQTLSFIIGGVTFYLIHNLADLPYPFPEADVIICGHTHAATTQTRRGTLILNPGSAGKPRTGQSSIAIMTIQDQPDAPDTTDTLTELNTPNIQYTFLRQ